MIAIAFIWLLAIIAGPAYAQTSPTGPGAQEQVGPVVNCTCPAGTIAVSNYNWSASLGPFPCNCLAVPSTPPTITYTACGTNPVWAGITWLTQNALKSWSCNIGSDGSVRFEVKPGDQWSGDVGRPTTYNRSQIVDYTSHQIAAGVETDYSFDVMFESGPVNDRDGLEFQELVNTDLSGIPFYCQIWTNGATEYLSFLTFISPASDGNCVPGATWACHSSYNTQGAAQAITRGVYHHMAVKFLIGSSGHIYVDWDGVRIFTYNGSVGSNRNASYQFGNYGAQPPTGSSDTDQIIDFKNGALP